MNEPLRILLVTKSTGGVAEYVLRLVKGLAGSRFHFNVACLSENGPQFAAQLSQIPGVSAFNLKMNRFKVDPVSDTAVLFSLARHLRHEHYDLIHAHASKPGFLTRLAAIGTGTPVLYSPHCFAFHAGVNPGVAMLVAFLERIAARFFTSRIVTVADGERKLAGQYHVGTDELFTTVHTGIDPFTYRRPNVDKLALRASLGIPSTAQVVGTVGRLTRAKSPVDFINMAGFVHQQMPEVHFVWVGSGEMLELVRHHTQEAGLDGVLHFAGHRADVPDLFQVLDCFVMTSEWEGFPMVLLEAMASGAPVVATNIFGIEEAIRPGVDGWLVSVHDPVRMAERVQDVLQNPQRANAFRVSARERVEREFTSSKMLETLSSVYSTVAVEAKQAKIRLVERRDGR